MHLKKKNKLVKILDMQETMRCINIKSEHNSVPCYPASPSKFFLEKYKLTCLLRSQNPSVWNIKPTENKTGGMGEKGSEKAYGDDIFEYVQFIENKIFLWNSVKKILSVLL